MVKHLATTLLIALLTMSVHKNVLAVEVLTAQELASHCEVFPEDSTSLDGEFCARYIQGFLDGAVTTDARVMLNVEANYRNDSFTERALRTRLPSREEYRRAARFAEFCLGDPVPLKEVVNHIVDDLNQLSAELKPSDAARDIVYASLKKYYPCAPD